MLGSSPPMNISKIFLHLHGGKFSCKTKWKLVKGLLYNQGRKERYTQSQAGREVKQSGWDPQAYHKLGDPPWRVRRSNYILGIPALGSNPRKTILLG